MSVLSKLYSDEVTTKGIEFICGKFIIYLRGFAPFQTIKLDIYAMKANFFVPINCHYICDDLAKMKGGKREPKLYQWLSQLPKDSVYFDIGTRFGQEVCLASSFKEQNVKVFGFDCNLYHSHFCCLNKNLMMTGLSLFLARSQTKVVK